MYNYVVTCALFLLLGSCALTTRFALRTMTTANLTGLTDSVVDICMATAHLPFHAPCHDRSDLRHRYTSVRENEVMRTNARGGKSAAKRLKTPTRIVEGKRRIPHARVQRGAWLVLAHRRGLKMAHRSEENPRHRRGQAWMRLCMTNAERADPAGWPDLLVYRAAIVNRWR
jgi:hypothetical protein